MSAERRRAILLDLMQSIKIAKPTTAPDGQKMFIVGVWVEEINDFLNWTVAYDPERGDNLVATGTLYPMNEILVPMTEALKGIV